MDTARLAISSTLQGKLPRLPFAEIKRTVLGERYELSLVFVGDALSRRLNRTYRGKDAPTNILSFPLAPRCGEIYIGLPRSRKEAKKFSMQPDQFIAYLFIHGLLHLKGFDHGSKMEKHERALLSRFRFS